MRNYVTTSLETHLFFTRIMKEHAMFLLVGFPEKETEYKKKAEWLREQFEDLHRNVTMLSDGMVGETVLASGEVVTEFTEKAEHQTCQLSGASIDTEITQAQKKLRPGNSGNISRGMFQQVKRLNQSALWLLNELIGFKEKILKEVSAGRLFTTNYPLLIEHILREAKLYRQNLIELERNGQITSKDLRSAEIFWNQIMMEHAQFIRGLLDPCECELMETADGFARAYCKLLEAAREQDFRTMEELTKETREKTESYRDFKSAGTEGITECKIRSIILPLLADHVLREAKHYLRILETEHPEKWQGDSRRSGQSQKNGRCS